MTVYTMRDLRNGESDSMCVCDAHAEKLVVDGERITAEPADEDCACEFCEARPAPEQA